ncbi:hypothetical protein D3C81_1774780 [compost metagenome]
MDNLDHEARGELGMDSRNDDGRVVTVHIQNGADPAVTETDLIAFDLHGAAKHSSRRTC